MSEQGTSHGLDSTPMASDHARRPSESETVPAEPAVESRSSAVPQDTATAEFARRISTSQASQDPRSTTAASGTQSPPTVEPSSRPVPSAVTRQHKRKDSQLADRQRPLSRPVSARQSSPLREYRTLRDRRQQEHHSLKPEPPVTKATLSELDVAKIIHNPKLRHDINYDPELHFRPNLDGEKGRRKQEKAQQFWNSLRNELIQFVTGRDEFLATHADGEWSLPTLLNAVKEIIQTLVPARDRALLDEGLNVPLLMQQFNRGVVDLEKLASWLSNILKLHCAPMRDDWVDEMYKELSRGNQNNDVDELVRGLCSLLSVLEAMKLDVANHQIRCLRPLLIEGTVDFEKKFFANKITRGMNVDAAREWYHCAQNSAASLPVRHRKDFGDDMAPFFSGLCQLLMPSFDAKKVPTTFLFDEERILRLRSDMLDAICLEMCMRVYETAEAENNAAVALHPQTVPSYILRPQTSCDSLSAAEDPDFDFNTPPHPSPASSRPQSGDFAAFGSPTSSPRNSATALRSGMAPPTSHAELAAARMRTQELYSRLVALLQTAPVGALPAHRWSDLRPKMAVEIYRTLSTVQQHKALSLDAIERRLEAAMAPESRTQTPLQQEIERSFHARLFTTLARRVREYKLMPSVGLFVVAAGGRIHPAPAKSPEATAAATAAAAAAAAAAATLAAQSARVLDPREDGGVEDMATRLAHLGLLHWRVWGDIVYAPVEPEEEL